MPKLSAQDPFYERLRTDLCKKLVRLPFRYFWTVEGTEHPGYVIPLGEMTEFVMVLQVPLSPPGVQRNPAPGWLLPKGYEEPVVPFASSADKAASPHQRTNTRGWKNSTYLRNSRYR
jgi:hypothetical protein